MKSRRGFILIIVLSLLAVLAFLTIGFVMSSQNSKSLAVNTLNKTKARLLARSGIEKVLANTSGLFFANNVTNFEQNPLFSGEDLNRNGNVSAIEDNLANGNGLEETFDLPLEEALCPSFALKDKTIVTQDQALLMTIDNKPRGLSWKTPQGDVNRIKMTALSNRIDLNGGIVQGSLVTDRANYDATFGETWSATNFNHAYNRPTVNFLNALGNYYLYINRPGAEDPTRTYQWDMPGDPSDLNNVTIDNARNTGDLNDAPPAPFAATLSYPPPDDPGTPQNETLTLGGLGHHLIQNRPPLGFDSIEQVKPLAIEWAQQQAQLDPEAFWLQIAELISINAQPRSSTRLWRQELLQPLDSGRFGNVNQFQLSRSLGPQGSDLTRAWLTARSYRQPRTLVNINTAPLPILAALIYAVKDIQYRHVSYDSIHSLTRPLYMSNHHLTQSIQFDGITILENHVSHSIPMDYAGPNIDLFSMTESIQMAKTIAKHRSQKPFTSYQEFYDFLIAYVYGFDAKSTDAIEGSWDEEVLLEGFPYFYDLFTDNERERLLWCVLNPNGNLRHFVFDEALPLSTHCKEFRYAHHANAPTAQHYRERRAEYGHIDFDKSYPHEFATEISFFDEGSFEIESQGLVVDPNGKILSQSKIIASAKLFETLHFTHQEDFASLLNQDGSPVTASTQYTHNAVTRDWITYPELPTAVPSQLDGQLALAPQTFYDIPGLGSLKSHHTFNPYHQLENPLDVPGPNGLNHPAKQQQTNLAPEWTTGAAYPSGSFVFNDNQQGDYFTPWQPEPLNNDLDLSLLSPTINSQDLEATNHFFPGGGIHPDAQVTTPLDGVPDETEISTERHLGGLVLEATNTSGNYLIANSQEGAVSFFFKPRHYPLVPYTVIRSESFLQSQKKYRRHDRTPYCLFDYHFYIKDSTVNDLIRAELENGNYHDPPFEAFSADPRADLYRCNIRLLYGQMWSSFPEEFLLSSHIKTSGPLRLFPLNGHTMPGYNENENESWMHNIELNDPQPIPENTFPKISTPYNFGFLFNNMNGMPLPFSNSPDYYSDTLATGGGYLQRGDLPQNFFNQAAGIPYHKYVSDKLWLEFRVSQVIESQTQEAPTIAGQEEPYKQRINLDPTIEGPAYSTSGLDLYENENISYNQMDGNEPNINFFLGDASETESFTGRSTGSHTVVKSFRLDYPIVLDPNSQNFALGPEDSQGNPQAMVNHGRWHHFLISWRNMDSLLQFNKDNHKGGAIALYHNGTFRKDVVTGDAIWPYRGMFWNTDFFTGYWQNTIYHSDETFGDGSLYGDSSFMVKPMDFIYPTLNRTPFFDLPPNTVGLELLPNTSFPFGGSVHLKGFGMEANNDYHPRSNLTNALSLLGIEPSTGQNYWLGSTGHYSGLQYFDVNGTQRVNEISGLMHHASNKFFFGAAPHCVDNWAGTYNQFLSYKYIADGNFMDIRIADDANGLYEPDDLVNGRGGSFIPNIPDYHQVSPYPTISDSGRLFPFALGPSTEPIRLLGFHWTAYLPPFHRFWDDLNGVADVWNEQNDMYDINVPNFPGPDKNDQLVLAANLETLNGNVWQRVHSGPQNDLYLEQAQPFKENKNYHVFDKPITVPNDRATSLNLIFQRVSPTPTNNSSTPLIDDLTFYQIPTQGIQIIMWQQN